MNMNNNARVSDVLDVYSTSYQIYKNMRTLVRNNPTMRATLNLNTRNPGVYLTDYIYGRIDRMIQFCQDDGFTVKRLQIIISELNRVEMIIKDVLQYYHYFYRPDFRQKPDVDIATEVYKEMADKKTVEDLRKIAGSNHMIDFENLGSSRIELTEELEYDEVVDGEMTDEEKIIIRNKKFLPDGEQ